MSVPRNRMRQMLPGGDYNPEDTANFRRDFYIYEADSGVVAAAASSNDTVTIEADSDFMLQKLSFFAINTAATTVVASPLMFCQITDTGSGRQLMSAPIPVPSFFGTGQLPFILPNPRKFMRNSTIQVAFTSFEAATSLRVRLAFIGYKVYGTA